MTSSTWILWRYQKPQPCTKLSIWSAKIKNVWCGEPQFAKSTINAIQIKDTTSHASVTYVWDFLLAILLWSCRLVRDSVPAWLIGRDTAVSWRAVEYICCILMGQLETRTRAACTNLVARGQGSKWLQPIGTIDVPFASEQSLPGKNRHGHYTGFQRTIICNLESDAQDLWADSYCP